MSGSLDLSQDELHSSRTPWKTPPPRRHDPAASFRCDLLIVGAGITGALLAERLTREGRNIVIVDREDPTQGSTLASTAMLLWDVDRSLSQLVDFYGFERAVRAYRASLAAARGLVRLARQLRIDCDMRRRNALYLAAGDRADDLVAEAALRVRARLPSTFLDFTALKERYRILRAGAVLSPEAADADPAALAVGLLDIAIERGARLRKGEATVFDSHGSGVTVSFSDGFEAEARHVVLATGYVMPKLVRATVQEVSSSWVIATTPQLEKLWPERARPTSSIKNSTCCVRSERPSSGPSACLCQVPRSAMRCDTRAKRHSIRLNIFRASPLLPRDAECVSSPTAQFSTFRKKAAL